MRKLNGYASIFVGILCLGIGIFFGFTGSYDFLIAFGIASIVFFYLAALFVKRSKYYFNAHNCLGLHTDNKDKIRDILRDNLISCGFVLSNGFYVNKNHKNYDVYFTTYDKNDIKEKAAEVAVAIGCNYEFLENSLKIGGFLFSEDDENLMISLSNTVRGYDNPLFYDDKKRSIVIMVDLDEERPLLKNLYFVGLVPFHRSYKYDVLNMIEFDTNKGVANLATRSDSHDADSRKIIKQIFKNVIKFS
jgi:hypothetical protein